MRAKLTNHLFSVFIAHLHYLFDSLTQLVCFLFSELEGNIPSTETQIYEKFAIATILRRVKREKKCTLQIKSLKNLDESVMETFLLVYSLAFDMTFNPIWQFLTIPDKLSFSLGYLLFCRHQDFMVQKICMPFII